MEGIARQTALDELHTTLQDANPKSRSERHKRLWGECDTLLTFAHPNSSTLKTQLVTFKILVALITRYPGLRRALRDCKHLKKASQTDPSFKKLWKPRYDFDAGEDWEFHRNFVAFCLSDLDHDSKNVLIKLVETGPPSQLGRVEFEQGTLNPVPIEILVGVSRSGPDFDFPRISAIRYLAGILELPMFWDKGSTELDRVSAIFSELCRTIHQLLDDTKIDVNQTSFASSPSMAAACEAVDILCRATFKALLNIRNPLPYPDLLWQIIDMFLQKNMSICFPRASTKALLVSKLLHDTTARDGESQRPPSPLAGALPTDKVPAPPSIGSLDESEPAPALTAALPAEGPVDSPLHTASSLFPVSNPQNNLAFPALYLYPLNDSFIPKHIFLTPSGQRVKIGRHTNTKTSPGERNGYFESKVLSRQHAEVWEENGKIFIKDVKSSYGTFVNGERLSPEALESEPFELKSEDSVELGIDIVGEDNKTIIHHKVAARVSCIFNEQQARAEQQNQGQYAQSSMMPQAGPPGSSPFNFAPV
ncbi:hypothetical protein C8R45DRAFT_963762 [Mycena sanguinolenta]|nr:hypothetical protein C8R45DRAFT_963762 [Mycena sanguinolenta]